MKLVLKLSGIVGIIFCFGVGWYVFFALKPDVIFFARLKYLQAIREKRDLSSGPCLGVIREDWVLDIAHLPRESLDDLPENQCASYINGQVKHFVEMTKNGEVIVFR